MKAQITAIALQVVMLLVPVLAALIIALISKAISWLSAKTKNEALLHLLAQLDAAATTAVNAAAQTVLKNPLVSGSLVEKQTEAKATAVDATKAQMGAPGLLRLQSALGTDATGMHKIISNHVEAKVLESKYNEVALGGAQ